MSELSYSSCSSSTLATKILLIQNHIEGLLLATNQKQLAIVGLNIITKLLIDLDIMIQTFLESEDSQNEEDKFLQNAVKFFDGKILEKK